MNFYRYQTVEYAGIDGDGEYISPRFPDPRLELKKYILIKETTKGYWINHGNFEFGKRWVSKTARSRFAYPTEKEALVNFIKRSERRIKILEWQKDSCSIALNRAKERLNSDQNVQECDATQPNSSNSAD